MQRNANPPLKGFIEVRHVSPQQQKLQGEREALPGVLLCVPTPGLGLEQHRAVAGGAGGLRMPGQR